MNRPEGIFTPYLDLNEHLLWMGERARDPKRKENRLQMYFILILMGVVMFSLGFTSDGVHAQLFRLIGVVSFVVLFVEYRFQLFFPSSVWYAITTKRILIRFPSRLKQKSLDDVDKIFGYRTQSGHYTVAFRNHQFRLIMTNILLHQLRQVIPLLQEYTSAEMDMPELPDQAPLS